VNCPPFFYTSSSKQRQKANEAKMREESVATT